MIGVFLAFVWLVCVALLVTGEGSGVLLILATLALLIHAWAQWEDPHRNTDWH